MKGGILARFSGRQRFVIRLIFYGIFIILFIPALFAYKIATPPRLKSPHTTPGLFDLPFEKKVWITPDGVRLKGWFIPSPDSKGIFVLVHGLGDSKEAYIPRAKMIFDSGYSVLLFDQRAHGESGGRFCTLGIKESRDLLHILTVMSMEGGKETVPTYLWGFSMGAACILNALPENPDVDGIVADSSFTTLKDTFHQHSDTALHIPSFPLSNIALFAYRIITGTVGESVSPLESVHRTRGYPILFVSRVEDDRIPPIQVKQLYDTYQGGKKDLWIIPGANHLYDGGKETEYWHRIQKFFSL